MFYPATMTESRCEDPKSSVFLFSSFVNSLKPWLSFQGCADTPSVPSHWLLERGWQWQPPCVPAWGHPWGLLALGPARCGGVEWRQQCGERGRVRPGWWGDPSSLHRTLAWGMFWPLLGNRVFLQDAKGHPTSCPLWMSFMSGWVVLAEAAAAVKGTLVYHKQSDAALKAWAGWDSESQRFLP